MCHSVKYNSLSQNSDPKLGLLLYLTATVLLPQHHNHTIIANKNIDEV